MKIFKLSLIFGLLFYVAGCATAPPPKEAAACPDWVNQGSGACGEGKNSLSFLTCSPCSAYSRPLFIAMAQSFSYNRGLISGL